LRDAGRGIWGEKIRRKKDMEREEGVESGMQIQRNEGREE